MHRFSQGKNSRSRQAIPLLRSIPAAGWLISHICNLDSIRATLLARCLTKLLYKQCGHMLN